MQRRALDVLGQAVLLGQAVGAHDAGDRRGPGQALLLDQQLERAVAAAAGRDLEHAGLGAALVEHGRTVRLCSSVRRAMSSASSSIETPALMRRTLAWLSTSLLKGMSREALRVIFGGDLAMAMFSATGRPGASLGLQPVTKPASLLFL